MIQNNLKLAFRNLWQNKMYSLINIGGLGLGMAICMLILLYVSHEMSYDRFHTKAERIFSTLMKLKMGENDLQMNMFTPDFAQKVKAANPEILESLRYASDFRGTPTVKSEEGRQFIEHKFFFADPAVFRVFSFDWLQGDVEKALDAPDAVVISDEMARKYFGEANPLDKTLIYNKKDVFRVSGVYAKMPENSSLRFDFIASTAAYERIQKRDNPSQNFDNSPIYQTWFLLDQANAKSKIEATIPAIMPKSDDPILNSSHYVLSPLLDMHLGNNWGDFSNSKYISIFLAVAALVLFLALFNYMNLSTARASTRALEVGVRKVLGAGSSQIKAQFYGESMLVSAMGFVVGLLLFFLLKPFFCHLLDLKIDAQFLCSSLFISVLCGLFFLSALVAGSYPAFMLSRFSPIQVMKGRSAIGKSGEGVRRGLTVFQFAISTGLIVFSLGVGAQLRYMHQHDIGLNREQVLAVPITKNIVRHTAAFKQDIRSLTGVQKVSMASFALFQGGWDMVLIQMPGTKEDVAISNMVVDEQFVETLEIQWINAPNNAREMAGRRQLLLNESGVEKLRLQDRPVGEQLDLGRGLQEIVGTVKDFNFVSLQSPVEGMLFEVVADTVAPRNPGGQLYVRLAPGTDVQSHLVTIEQMFKKYESDAPFDYYFLDEAFDQQHRAERRMGYLFSGFTGVAILLACLGLFGLITFAAERRTKEIGIRKVLGASVAGITGLLVKDFLKLVLLAIAIASPAAYYFIEKWLSDFAYRIDIQWWMFALAGTSAVLIACLPLAFQSVKAALADPVKSLRNE